MKGTIRLMHPAEGSIQGLPGFQITSNQNATSLEHQTQHHHPVLTVVKIRGDRHFVLELEMVQKLAANCQAKP